MESELEITEDYQNLKQNYSRLKEEHEKTKQELYECKRNLKSMEFLQEECQNEIDMLQSEEIKQKQKYQEIIKQLEKNMNDMRSSHSEEKEALGNIIMKMEEQNEMMKCELNIFKESNNVTNFGDTSSLINEILSEPPEYYENQELKDNLSELMEKNEKLENKVQEYEREIENLKESFLCQKRELSEALGNSEFLSDENICLKLELESFKNKPLNKDSKGNSLFAEVDDRRVYLQDKINKMGAAYVAMTQEKAQLQNSIHHLKLENLRLLEKWRNDIDEKYDDEDRNICSLRSKIKVLEDLVAKYKKDLEEKPVVISNKTFEEYEYFEMVLDEKSKLIIIFIISGDSSIGVQNEKEIESLRNALSEKSVSYMSFAKEIQKVNEEKRKWKLEAMTTLHKLELLQRETNSSSNSQEEGKEMHNKDEKTEHNKERNIIQVPENKGVLENINRSQQNISLRKHSQEYRHSRTPLRENLSDLKDESFRLKYPEEELNLKDNSPKEESGVETEKDFIQTTGSDSIKENVAASNQTIRKVTFAGNILSPKPTARRNCTRIRLSKPIPL